MLLKTWKRQGPIDQLNEQWTRPRTVLLTANSAVKLEKIQLGSTTPELKTELEGKNNNTTIWKLTPLKDLKYLFSRQSSQGDSQRDQYLFKKDENVWVYLAKHVRTRSDN